MKSFFLRLFCLILILSSLSFYAGCKTDTENSSGEKISIVCTAFPQYDFVRNIIEGKEDQFEVTYLFDNGADVHSFQTDVDFKVKIKIIESDIFIYNGGESDSWVKSILDDKSMKSECKAFSLIDLIEKKSLITTSNHETHSHETSYDECHEHSNSFDEHVWLSLKNAVFICQRISEEIISLDSENKTVYENNLSEYCEKLNALDKEAKEYFMKIESPYVVVADRFPFVYLLNDYNIMYDSAFSGCTSETEATYDNIIKLCNAIEKHNVDSIFVLEKSNTNISSSIISATNKELQILSLNSMQSVSRKEIESGFNYYCIMKNNIDSIISSMQKT